MDEVETCGGCAFFIRCPYKKHEVVGWCDDNKEFTRADTEICPCEVERREPQWWEL